MGLSPFDMTLNYDMDDVTDFWDMRAVCGPFGVLMDPLFTNRENSGLPINRSRRDYPQHASLLNNRVFE